MKRIRRKVKSLEKLVSWNEALNKGDCEKSEINSKLSPLKVKQLPKFFRASVGAYWLACGNSVEVRKITAMSPETSGNGNKTGLVTRRGLAQLLRIGEAFLTKMAVIIFLTNLSEGLRGNRLIGVLRSK